MSKVEKSRPSLAALQDQMQAALLSGDDAILNLLCDNSRTSRRVLFGVYRNAYVGRLVEVLKNDYPLLSGYLGADAFSDLAQNYITAHPSRTQNARWFGATFPAFLANDVDLGGRHPQYSDLASIEKATADAFDSADAPTLTIADLISIPPDNWNMLAFSPHPSVQTLAVTTNAFAIWKALQTDETAPPLELLPAPQRLVVWRPSATPKLRMMSEEEWMMWSEARRGVRFDMLCEMLATFDDPDGAATRAAGYLQGWLTCDMLQSATFVEQGNTVEA